MDQNAMNIGIIGLGYVGLTLAVAAADSGLTVYGTEINPHIRECLASNRAHFFEAGLDALLAKHNGKRFFCVDAFPTDVRFDAFVITVGTPLKKDTKEPNFDDIRRSLTALSDVYTEDRLVILRSTVSVGTTRRIVLPCLAEMCGRPESELLVAMCPERTIAGKAVEELRGLPQIIGGNNRKSLEMAEKVFSRITDRVIPVDSPEEAEIVKLYCNVWRDTMFAVGNVFCLAAQEFGIDGIKAIRAAGDGYPRANIALPGFVAGPCLEKDAYLLTNTMPDCSAKDFILSERQFNESLEDVVTDWVVRRLADKPVRTVALSGMAFKGRPETSDLRGSPSVYIARKLHAKGYALRLHDFVAMRSEMDDLALGVICETPEEACDGATLLLVLNNHPKYADMRLDLPPGFAVLDAWGVCERLNDPTTLGNIKWGGVV